MDWIPVDQLEIKPKWSKRQYNRWTDYIEIRCFADGFISKGEIVDSFKEGDIDNEYDRGGSSHVRESLELESLIDDYFLIIRYRSEEFKEYYPFEVEGDCLKLREDLSEKNNIYLFFLLCSCISLMDGSKSNKLTHDFEKVSVQILKALSPEKATVELFGTSRDGDFFGRGNQRTRIQNLVKYLGANVTSTFNRDSRYDYAMGGDNGLDIVSFFPIDKASYIPFAFAQCTCSYDKWEIKQNSINYDKWNKVFEPFVEYPKFMLVPFSCHDSKNNFYSETGISTFLIDRDRIIRILRDNTIIEDIIIEHISTICF